MKEDESASDVIAGMVIPTFQFSWDRKGSLMAHMTVVRKKV